MTTPRLLEAELLSRLRSRSGSGPSPRSAPRRVVSRVATRAVDLVATRVGARLGAVERRCDDEHRALRADLQLVKAELAALRRQDPRDL